MTQVVSKIFGGGDDTGNAIMAQLAAQKSAQTAALASSVNAEAASEQDLAKGSRLRGGRKLLTYLGDNTGDGTLG